MEEVIWSMEEVIRRYSISKLYIIRRYSISELFIVQRYSPKFLLTLANFLLPPPTFHQTPLNSPKLIPTPMNFSKVLAPDNSSKLYQTSPKLIQTLPKTTPSSSFVQKFLQIRIFSVSGTLWVFFRW